MSSNSAGQGAIIGFVFFFLFVLGVARFIGCDFLTLVNALPGILIIAVSVGVAIKYGLDVLLSLAFGGFALTFVLSAVINNIAMGGGDPAYIPSVIKVPDWVAYAKIAWGLFTLGVMGWRLNVMWDDWR